MFFTLATQKGSEAFVSRGAASGAEMTRIQISIVVSFMAEIVTALAVLWIEITLFSSYLCGFVTRAHELCPPLGVCWRSQCFPPPSMCLTNPLWGTCPSLPKRLWGPWSALGCSCCCIHPCSSPFSARLSACWVGPGYLSCVSKC